MGSAFSQNNEIFRLRIVHSIKSKKINNADEIMDTIKEFRIEIAEHIEELESIRPATDDIDRQIAVLIRQDQYLEVLQSKQKSELAELFFEKEDNCIVPEVFQWYQGPSWKDV